MLLQHRCLFGASSDQLIRSYPILLFPVAPSQSKFQISVLLHRSQQPLNRSVVLLLLFCPVIPLPLRTFLQTLSSVFLCSSVLVLSLNVFAVFVSPCFLCVSEPLWTEARTSIF